MNNKFHIEKIIDQATLALKVKELAASITKDLKDSKGVVFVCLLRGGFIFMADLVRELKLSNVLIDFMMVSSYGNSSATSGNVKIIKDLEQDINNKDIVIIEDIVDSGLTLQKIVGVLEQRKPSSLRIATLLNKQERRQVDIKAHYIGFEIPDYFVVGYGIDYGQKYRELPYLAKVVFDD